MDAGVFLRFADLAVEGLAEAREEINGLNVFPVPDADTGTNMYLTMTAARDAAYAVDGSDMVAVVRALGTGALTGARGNSGVITAQIMGAVLRHIAAASPTDEYARMVAAALNAAADAAYAAVGDPQEGTMLTVWRAAAVAGAAAAADDPQAHTGDVLAAAVVAAREALLRTPEQLDVLRAAGVVDAGGRGACVVLEAAERALTGRRREPLKLSVTRAVAPAEETSVGPAYEVMYLLNAADEAIAPLKASLAPLGDCLVVVGAEGLWNVHVHVDDVGAAIEAGMAAGRPHRIKVTHFGAQSAPVRQGRAVVAVSVGTGLTELMRESGAIVLEGRGQSSANILAAIRASGAAEVILLPNDEDSLANAEIAASAAEIDDEVKVAVIPTRSQVQGLAALAVHDPHRPFDKDVLAVATTASQVRRGGVTIATLKAFTSAGPCEVGDVLGAIGGDFVVIGSDLVDTAIEVVRRLVGGGGELVTLVTGAKDPDGTIAAAVTDWLAQTHPTIEAITYVGGQERYPLLIAVE